jgi:glyoxylase-like metal-dependent hydrolase (beta-lactamase superfamily II)
MTAELTVLHAGYATAEGVASSVVLVRDGASTVVVDPGMVRSSSLILEPMAALGVAPADVTDVVLSHPRATDLPALHTSRERLLALGPVQVVPGHGPAFAPDSSTPR